MAGENARSEISVTVLGENEVAWHALQDTGEVLSKLGSSPDGLSEDVAIERLERNGLNRLTPAEKPSFLKKLWGQVNNVLIFVLIAAAIVEGALQKWPEFGLIFAVVAINVTFGLVQEGKAEKAAEALKAMLSPLANVVRDGEQLTIEADELVVGDIVLLKSGDKVPADLRLLECNNFQVQEAMLTGESVPVSKHINAVAPHAPLGDRKCMAFSATNVSSGQGRGVVVATGDNAEIGKINTMVNKVDKTKTNLMLQLQILGRWLSLMVLVIALVSFFLAMFRADQGFADAFESAVAIAVAIIPEGLPALVTIVLAIGTTNMARSNAIIRQLPAVETLGSLTVICSDKTGTLTKNEMTLVAIRTADALYKVTGIGYAPVGGFRDTSDERLEAEDFEKLRGVLEGAMLCNDSALMVNRQFEGNAAVPSPAPAAGDVGKRSMQLGKQSAGELGKGSVGLKKTSVGLKKNSIGLNRLSMGREYVPVGAPTEVALITAGMKAGLMMEQVKQDKPRIGSVPFESEHKFMATVHQEGTKRVMYVKGAPDRLLPLCTSQLVGGMSGTAEPLNLGYWQEQQAELSSQGLRMLALCRAEVPDDMDLSALTPQGILQHQPFLSLCSMMAILDPPREEAIEAVKVAHKAGIEVKMITGDHALTAKAIGQALGIAQATSTVLTGAEVDGMTEEQLQEAVMGCNIYARASPANKIQIVRALQKKRQIVAMTGDGVNDAPALKAANVGVAMGITGTDVSKEAANMVLADDNFASIVSAVREGRRVWDNLRKILVFNLPVNLAQGTCILWSYVLAIDVPLTAIQVLYVNLVTGVTLGLMLAAEPAEPTVMDRPPRRPSKRLFGKLIIWRCFFVSTLIVVLVLGMFYWGQQLGLNLEQRRAEAFNVLVFAQIAYSITTRYVKETTFTLRIFRGNRWCFVAAGITIALQMFATYTPGVNGFFEMAPMGGLQWVRVLVCAVAVYAIVEVEKLCVDPVLMPFIKPVLRWAEDHTPVWLQTESTKDKVAARAQGGAAQHEGSTQPRA